MSTILRLTFRYDRVHLPFPSGKGRWTCRVFSSWMVFLSLSCAVAGCVSPLEDSEDLSGAVTASFALSLKNTGSAQEVGTKMTTDITQSGNQNVFRGIEEVYIFPFNKANAAEEIQGDDQKWGGRVALQNPRIIASFANDAQGGRFSGLVNGNNSRLYSLAIIPKGTNRLLAYGKAIDQGVVSTKEEKHSNGVLNLNGWESADQASDISFSLEPILSGDPETGEIKRILDKADEIIAALNNVVNTIRETNNPSIISLLSVFSAREGQILACSYQTFYKLWSDILVACNALPYNESVIYDKIEVSAAINYYYNVLAGAGDTFPRSYGIPEGAVGFWWNGNGFIRLINTVNVALVDLSYYCYPPSLWYYANSPIRTSKNNGVTSQYVSTNTWGQILRNYEDAESVWSSTQSVAMVDPLQYGVGMLEISLSELGPEALEVAGGCPLTGIIIGDQKDVDFSFKPKASISRYVYDNVVGNLLLGGELTGETVQTLVLQTRDKLADFDNPVVHFALEFQNTTGKSIRGQQGDILPWCRFYLAGKLYYNDATADQTSNSSIFCQDQKTTVSIKINNLRAAYATVPDLHDPQLEIGILAEMKWQQVSPGNVKMDI